MPLLPSTASAIDGSITRDGAFGSLPRQLGASAEVNLRLQMLLAGAMTLVVPVVGWQSVGQLHDSLLQSRMDAQQLTVANLRLSMAQASVDDELRSVLDWGSTAPAPGELYVEVSPAPLTVDGYASDWQALAHAPIRYSESRVDSISIRMAERDQRLHVLVDVDDDELVWHRPPRLIVDAGENEGPDPEQLLSNGDAVEVLLVHGDKIARHVLLRALAPGPLQPLAASMANSRRGTQRAIRSRGERLTDIRAAWQQRSGGYRVEMSFASGTAGVPLRLGIAVLDVDDRTSEASSTTVGSLSLDDMQGMVRGHAELDAVPAVFRTSSTAQELLRSRVPPGHRARVFDRVGRLVADVDRLNDRREDAIGQPLFENLWDAVLFRVFAWLVAGDLPLPEAEADPAGPLELELDAVIVDGETHRYVTPARDRVLGTVVPVEQNTRDDTPTAWLWYESNEEHSSAYTGSHLARLLSLLILASLVAALVLFSWGAWLSLRIRRLSQAAGQAVADDGRPRKQPMKASAAQDELGSLSRDLASLLGRSADYNRYLETLSRYLSHELRTPLSVVRSSLENLQHAELEESARTLVMRAAGGTRELNRIISAIVESTRLEHTIEHAEYLPIDLTEFLDDCVERFRHVYPDHQIIHRALVKPATMVCSPALMVQALDKLVDNAVTYSAQGTSITLVLRPAPSDCRGNYLLAVESESSDASPSEQREPTQNDASERHMGLGLHMVAMIAEAHGGRLYRHEQNGRFSAGMTFGDDYPVG